ncbi:MAG: SLC13 family permease [Verrucomicrobiota bacterium]
MLPLLAFTESTQQIVATIIVVLMFVAFVRERIAPEIVALGGFAAMVLAGILPVESAMKAFSNEAVVMIASMLVICIALERAGVVAAAGAFYEKISGRSQRTGLWVLMAVCGVMSAFLNNTSIVIIFLPVVMAVCRRQGVAPSRMLIPLSFATVAGGMITLIGTSTNMVVVGQARDYGLSFSMFEISGLGLAVFGVSLVYLGILGPRLLPDRVALSNLLEDAKSKEYLTRAFVSENSPLIGKLYAETPLARLRGIRLIDVIRTGVMVETSFMELRLEAGDQLVLKGRLEDVMTMRQTQGLEMVPRESLGLEGVKMEQAVMMEAVLGPGSTILHKSLKQLNFRQRYGVIIVAVHRMGVNLRERFEDMRFMMGDTLLLEGPPEQMSQLFKERGFINLTRPKDTRPRREKRWIALGILFAVCLLGALAETGTEKGGTILTDWGMPDLNFGLIALTGALLCVLTRCVDTSEIYEAMEWRILLLIIGTVGIGAGMEKCGLAGHLARSIVGIFSQFGDLAVLSAVYLIAVILTEFLSNAAVAAIITPIAMQTALSLHVDPKPFVIAAMFGSTLAFSTPIGYQTNLLVYNAGGYKFTDFCRIGIPLTLLLWLLCTFLIPVFWPLTRLP